MVLLLIKILYKIQDIYMYVYIHTYIYIHKIKSNDIFSVYTISQIMHSPFIVDFIL